MSDKYFNADVNRSMCAEYGGLEAEKPPYISKRSVEISNRKEQIRQHIAFEVLAAYAHDHGPEEAE